MWNRYGLELRFTGLLMGGVPKHPQLIQTWLEARAPTVAPPDATPLPELACRVVVAVHAEATEENKVWTGFQSDDTGLYVPGFHLKAHLKDIANIARSIVGEKESEIKNLKSKLADRVFVEEENLYLYSRRGERWVDIPAGRVKEPTAFWEHPVHIMTMQGPRSALKRNDYVVQPTLRATLRVLADKVITEAVLRNLLNFGSMKGFGAERGLGHGRYEFTLSPIE